MIGCYAVTSAVPAGGEALLAYAELPAARPAGSAPSAPGWLVEEREQPGGGPRVAAVGYLRRGRSLVFNAGTADWACTLPSRRWTGSPQRAVRHRPGLTGTAHPRSRANC